MPYFEVRRQSEGSAYSDLVVNDAGLIRGNMIRWNSLKWEHISIHQG